MIITCPNCKKNFQIDPALLPEEGRDFKCGSCQKVWFYKAEKESSLPLTLNENFVNKEIENNFPKKNMVVKFFSYLIVLIISFVALIIFIDTLKTPIINVFPGVEIILFNIFETLKDIKLFIIDLY